LALLLEHTFDLHLDIDNITILSSSNAGTSFENEKVVDLLQVCLFFEIQECTAIPDCSSKHDHINTARGLTGNNGRIGKKVGISVNNNGLPPLW
jgi:hypothetical protein